MIKSIPNFQNYFLSKDNNRLFGLSADGPQEIIISNVDESPMVFKNFFRVQDIIYVHVSEMDLTDPENPVTVDKYYSQLAGEVKSIEGLPVIPGSVRSVYTSEEFTLSTFDYQGTDYTDVHNLATESGTDRNGMIDGFCHIQGVGLYFNVSDSGGAIKPPALYYWPLNRSSVHKVLDVGRVW